MAEPLIDLGGPLFWLAALVALVVRVPLTEAKSRNGVLAAINLGVLAFLLGPSIAWVLAGLVLVHLALRRIERIAVLIPLVAAVLSLFLFRKLPEIAPAELAPAQTILGAIGISYVALRLTDVISEVRAGRQPAPDLVSLINYLLPFNMLAAGPIQSYEAFSSASEPPPAVDLSESLDGFDWIASGLFKKYVLAYGIEKLCLTGFTSSGWAFVVEVQLYAVWFYLDFSAYSEVALGVGRLVQIPTPVNFDRPYLARNLINFWERWHISLSLFIRRLLFIPIQLNLLRRFRGERPLLAASLAFGVSFVLCGLWHGVSLRFLAWGAMHAAGLIATNAYREWLIRRFGRGGLKRYLERRSILWMARVATFEYVAFSLLIIGYRLPRGGT
jgi:alginate O-acetyltransferase complex protein AlgI